MKINIEQVDIYGYILHHETPNNTKVFTSLDTLFTHLLKLFENRANVPGADGEYGEVKINRKIT